MLCVACKPSTKKLDEAMLYDGPRFRLKVVRYYENLPMHYTGEVFRVLCSSANTAASPANPTQEAGWVTLGNGGAIGSGSAGEIATRERSNYTVINDTTLVWAGTGFNVSFDMCGSRRTWLPTSLPLEAIDTLPKPDHCAPKGTADCRHYDFLGDRQPRFTNIRVDGSVVEFTATSPAFRDGGSVHVRSVDGGKSWNVASAPGPS